MDQPDRARDPGANALARLAHRRVVAVDERHGGDAPGADRGLDHLLGAAIVDRQRLLADDVLARRQRGFGERQVQVIGGADVDDVDIRRLDQLLRGREGAFRS